MTAGTRCIGQNGEPLQVRHGFPARLVVAGLYGYVSATKWIEEINLTTWEAFNGYWIDLGWSKDGPMKTAYIDVPQHRSRITAGTTPIAASPGLRKRASRRWRSRSTRAPGRPVTSPFRVPTILGPMEGRLERPGVHRIDVRAIDKHGEIQPVGPKTALGWRRGLPRHPHRGRR